MNKANFSPQRAVGESRGGTALGQNTKSTPQCTVAEQILREIRIIWDRAPNMT